MLGDLGYLAGILLFMATMVLIPLYMEHGTSLTILLTLLLFVHWFLVIVGIKYCNQTIGTKLVKLDGDYKIK